MKTTSNTPKRQKKKSEDWYKRKFRYWPRPKSNKEEDYGPTPFQKKLWIEQMPEERRKDEAHLHDLDITLFLGGTRSGKTLAAIARCLYIARNYPGARIFVGSLHYTHLEQTVIADYKRLLSINGGEWNHPCVLRKPSGKHKRLKIRCAGGRGISEITFCNLENYEKALGTEADVWHIEEPELLDSEEPLELAITRMSSPAVPFKQIILTANPFARGLDWLVEWFNLRQFEAGYSGEKQPVGKPCTCQLCGDCEEKEKEVLFIDGVCPECGKVKTTKCPGNQYNKRVIISDASMNPHLPDNYKKDLRNNLSKDKQMAFGKGLVFLRNKGTIYSNMSADNIYAVTHDFDNDRPIIWTHDINRMPMCSVLCQERTEGGIVHIDVLDEIVVPNAGPEEVARQFIDRYEGRFTNTIKIYGDPSGFNGAKKGKELDRYNLIAAMLREKGFKAEVIAAHTVYGIQKRFDSVNSMLRSAEGLVRLRINPSLHWITRSLQKTVWASNGKKEDERNDNKYRDKGKPDEIWDLTHPAAALGYYIVQEHPNVKEDAQSPFMHNVNAGTVLELTDSDRIVRTMVITEDDNSYDRILEQLEHEELEAAMQLELDRGPTPLKVSDLLFRR